MIGAALDSNPLRIAAYIVTAVACAYAGTRARRRETEDDDDSEWATFWYAIAVVLGMIALVRITGIAGTFSDFMHRKANSEGWYFRRREFQVPVVIAVVVIWIVSMPFAWRAVRDRSRRVQLAAVIVVCLLCFAVIRLISLHQVDHLVYREEVLGVRAATWIELGGLAALSVLACIDRAPRMATSDASTTDAST